MGDFAYDEMRYNSYDNYDADEDFGVDMASVEDSFTPIPEGDYVLRAIDQKLKGTKDGNGQLVSVTFEVVDGPHAKRQVYENFNVRNSNTQTVQIALRAIKGWIKATGGSGDERLTMGLIRSLEGREFLGHVYVEPAKGQWDAKNRIRFGKCKPVQNSAAPAQQPMAPQSAPQQPAQAPQPQQSAPNLAGQQQKRPWER
ncbi:DUF669 domain-containing protein [Magnetofaba australis]|nr:DUF669 domain-containing protein [Magnetofaba australis]